jgi:hypothetical protein
VLRGSSTYVYDGNWKLQSENGADGYHVRKGRTPPGRTKSLGLAGVFL